MKKVLTIAGSDSTGGAGIEADLKTFQEYGVFGFASIAAIVTMDPTTGWSHEVTAMTAALVEKQLISAFAGEPMDALKTGILGNEANIAQAAKMIQQQQVKQVVVDPVIACKGTANILQPKSVDALKEHLLPLADVATPNLIEAGILSGLGDLQNIADMKAAAKKIYQLGAKCVVVKGGHRLASPKAIDVVYDGQSFTILESQRIETDFNHGAGCTFSAAITAGLAKGLTTLESIKLAKDFVAAAIRQGVLINPYVGHVWHGAYNHAEERMSPNE
ncbi:bifunctional hydroxymethylpyrimidine kinase/phosphomethylpyrimidine kinase [Enterococcus sp.]|uniref:bifunctional hydroxymethylpyrimidine kinase/phosphomethylpyrimidine kinase n=1 Tax=Enterococcus sp. TaxID=35783 RepID=UPI0025BEFFF6|nr:bifunctional hydroxymethylpyrimidine kinase/phosphomethylpyrimidine kinase [Enterococcus sp.]